MFTDPALLISNDPSSHFPFLPSVFLSHYLHHLYNGRIGTFDGAHAARDRDLEAHPRRNGKKKKKRIWSYTASKEVPFFFLFWCAIGYYICFCLTFMGARDPKCSGCPLSFKPALTFSNRPKKIHPPWIKAPQLEKSLQLLFLPIFNSLVLSHALPFCQSCILGQSSLVRLLCSPHSNGHQPRVAANQ